MNSGILEQNTAAGMALPNNCISQIDLLHFPDVFIALTDKGIIQLVNKAYEDLFGYQQQEVTGRNYQDFVFPDDDKKVRDFIQELRINGSATNFVHRACKKDGAVLHLSWSAYWSEKEQLIFSVGRDVTELVNAQQKQLAKEHLFQALIENSFDLLALTDEQGKYLYVSDTLNNLFDYKPSELLGTNCFDYIHPDDLPRIMEQFSGLLEQNKKIQVPPYRFRNAAGDWLWMEAIVTNQLNHPAIKGIVVSVRDINHQVNTEMKLKEMQFIEALMEGEEKERSRIARDLHDEVSGMIAAAKMHFASLVVKSAQLSERKEYTQGMDLLETAALQVRRTSHNLMPEILLENGLTEALNRYCYNVSNDKLNCTFLPVGVISRYSSNFELSLYRIAQELINNIVKHANATTALVQLSQHANILSLTIEDNGAGFSQDEQIKGTGLNSVRKRVEAMSGYMELDSEPGTGTHIFIEFEK